MRLHEMYTEVVLKEFWGKLEKELTLSEADNGGLDSYIQKANELIFSKFKINPSENVYFIAGSARLYLYPTLREAFDLTETIGDLDIVIPDQKHWINAGLEKEWNEGGIYRPTPDGEVEAFNIWDPSKAGGAYADVNVRSTDQIMADSTQIKGYYFMSLADVIDYKTSLNRDKEREIINLTNQYAQSGTNEKNKFLRMIVRAIGLDKTKELLGTIKK